MNVKVCYPTPDPAPTITSPADGTSTQDSSILLSGQATPNVPVYVYRNDIQVGFVTAAGDGSFALSVSLVIGTNVLKASTNNDCHAPTYSGTVTVERKSAQPPSEPNPAPEGEGPSEGTPEAPVGEQPPETPTAKSPAKPSPRKQPPGELQAPIILQPEDGAVVHEPFVLAVGEASPRTSVRILRDDQLMAEVLSDDEGKFVAKVPLEPGANRLMAAVGVLFSKTVTVTYEPTKPNDVQYWLIRGILVTVGLSFGLLLLVFGKRIGHILAWWRAPKR